MRCDINRRWVRGRAVALVLSFLLILCLADRGKPAQAQTLTGLRLPVAAGTTWKVLQGYNGGTHVPGPERYALDLVRDGDGSTTGSEVLAPAAGTMWWMNPPGAGNGCVLIRLDNTNDLIVVLCHLFARPFRRDEPIQAGQVVGTLGPAGTVGNNGIAHLHISLHHTPDLGVTRIPAPFALPDGLPLEGMSLPPDGSYNQYVCPGTACRAGLKSSNSPGARPPAAAPGPATPAVPLRAGVVARVAGAGDCVNVRDAAGLSGRVLNCLPDGTAVTVEQGPVTLDGRVWWRFKGLGWSVEEYYTGVTPPAVVMQTGVTAVIDAGEGDCLNLRTAPTTGANVVTCLPSGARLPVTDGPRDADGRTWWQLDGRGWVAGDYLQLKE